MLDPSVSLDRKSTLDHAEKSEKKESKKADKELETIFDEYMSDKVSREKSTEKQSRKFSQMSFQSRLDHETDFMAAKINGQIREDADQAKDRTDSTSVLDMSLSRSNHSGVQEPQSKSSDEKDASEAVEKLQTIIADMDAKRLSESDFLVSVEGKNGIKVNIAMVRTRQQTEIFVSSDSEQALDLISNQANRIERALKVSNELKVTLSVVS